MELLRHTQPKGRGTLVSLYLSLFVSLVTFPNPTEQAVAQDASIISYDQRSQQVSLEVVFSEPIETGSSQVTVSQDMVFIIPVSQKYSDMTGFASIVTDTWQVDGDTLWFTLQGHGNNQPSVSVHDGYTPLEVDIIISYSYRSTLSNQTSVDTISVSHLWEFLAVKFWRSEAANLGATSFQVTVTFEEPIDPSTLEEADFYVENGRFRRWSLVEDDPEHKIYRGVIDIYPDTDLPVYTVDWWLLPGSVLDADGVKGNSGKVPSKGWETKSWTGTRDNTLPTARFSFDLEYEVPLVGKSTPFFGNIHVEAPWSLDLIVDVFAVGTRQSSGEGERVLVQVERTTEDDGEVSSEFDFKFTPLGTGEGWYYLHVVKIAHTLREAIQLDVEVDNDPITFWYDGLGPTVTLTAESVPRFPEYIELVATFSEAIQQVPLIPSTERASSFFTVAGASLLDNTLQVVDGATPSVRARIEIDTSSSAEIFAEFKVVSSDGGNVIWMDNYGNALREHAEGEEVSRIRFSPTSIGQQPICTCSTGFGNIFRGGVFIMTMHCTQPVIGVSTPSKVLDVTGGLVLPSPDTFLSRVNMTEFTFSVELTEEGDSSIAIAAGKMYSQLLALPNAWFNLPMGVDTTRPEVFVFVFNLGFDTVDGVVVEHMQVTVDLSEPIRPSVLEIEDFVVTVASGNTTSTDIHSFSDIEEVWATRFRVIVSIPQSFDMTDFEVHLPEGVIVDYVDNPSYASNVARAVNDVISVPAVALSLTGPTPASNNDTFYVVAHFSEPIEGLTTSDFQVEDGTIVPFSLEETFIQFRTGWFYSFEVMGNGSKHGTTIFLPEHVCWKSGSEELLNGPSNVLVGDVEGPVGEFNLHIGFGEPMNVTAPFDESNGDAVIRFSLVWDEEVLLPGDVNMFLKTDSGTIEAESDMTVPSAEQTFRLTLNMSIWESLPFVSVQVLEAVVTDHDNNLAVVPPAAIITHQALGCVFSNCERCEMTGSADHPGFPTCVEECPDCVDNEGSEYHALVGSEQAYSDWLAGDDLVDDVFYWMAGGTPLISVSSVTMAMEEDEEVEVCSKETSCEDLDSFVAYTVTLDGLFIPRDALPEDRVPLGSSGDDFQVNVTMRTSGGRESCLDAYFSSKSRVICSLPSGLTGIGMGFEVFVYDNITKSTWVSRPTLDKVTISFSRPRVTAVSVVETNCNQAQHCPLGSFANTIFVLVDINADAVQSYRLAIVDPRRGTWTECANTDEEPLFVTSSSVEVGCVVPRMSGEDVLVHFVGYTQGGISTSNDAFQDLVTVSFAPPVVEGLSTPATSAFTCTATGEYCDNLDPAGGETLTVHGSNFDPDGMTVAFVDPISEETFVCDVNAITSVYVVCQTRPMIGQTLLTVVTNTRGRQSSCLLTSSSTDEFQTNCKLPSTISITAPTVPEAPFSPVAGGRVTLRMSSVPAQPTEINFWIESIGGRRMHERPCTDIEVANSVSVLCSIGRRPQVSELDDYGLLKLNGTIHFSASLSVNTTLTYLQWDLPYVFEDLLLSEPPEPEVFEWDGDDFPEVFEWDGDDFQDIDDVEQNFDDIDGGDEALSSSDVSVGHSGRKLQATTAENRVWTIREDDESEVTLELSLPRAPTAVVTVPVSSLDPSEAVVVSGPVVTFTPENWNATQVIIRALQDTYEDGDVNFSIYFGPSSSEDLSFHNWVTTVPFQNKDASSAAVLLTPVDDIYRENWRVVDRTTVPGVSLELSTKPTAPVTVLLSATLSLPQAQEGTTPLHDSRQVETTVTISAADWSDDHLALPMHYSQLLLDWEKTLPVSEPIVLEAVIDVTATSKDRSYENFVDLFRVIVIWTPVQESLTYDAAEDAEVFNFFVDPMNTPFDTFAYFMWIPVETEPNEWWSVDAVHSLEDSVELTATSISSTQWHSVFTIPLRPDLAQVSSLVQVGGSIGSTKWTMISIVEATLAVTSPAIIDAVSDVFVIDHIDVAEPGEPSAFITISLPVSPNDDVVMTLSSTDPLVGYPDVFKIEFPGQENATNPSVGASYELGLVFTAESGSFDINFGPLWSDDKRFNGFILDPITINYVILPEPQTDDDGGDAVVQDDDDGIFECPDKLPQIISVFVLLLWLVTLVVLVLAAIDDDQNQQLRRLMSFLFDLFFMSETALMMRYMMDLGPTRMSDAVYEVIRFLSLFAFDFVLVLPCDASFASKMMWSLFGPLLSILCIIGAAWILRYRQLLASTDTMTWRDVDIPTCAFWPSLYIGTLSLPPVMVHTIRVLDCGSGMEFLPQPSLSCFEGTHIGLFLAFLIYATVIVASTWLLWIKWIPQYVKNSSGETDTPISFISFMPPRGSVWTICFLGTTHVGIVLWASITSMVAVGEEHTAQLVTSLLLVIIAVAALILLSPFEAKARSVAYLAGPLVIFIISVIEFNCDHSGRDCLSRDVYGVAYLLLLLAYGVFAWWSMRKNIVHTKIEIIPTGPSTTVDVGVEEDPEGQLAEMEQESDGEIEPVPGELLVREDGDWDGERKPTLNDSRRKNSLAVPRIPPSIPPPLTGQKLVPLSVGLDQMGYSDTEGSSADSFSAGDNSDSSSEYGY